MNLTIVHTHSILELYYTLYPFILSTHNYKKKIKFVHLHSKSFKKSEGNNVLFIRIFKGKFDNHEFIKSTLNDLRERFENVFFLDDSAGADSTHFEFINQLDGYFKAKLLKNDSDYFKKMYGRQVFSNYYHQNFGIEDKKSTYREPLQDHNQLNKLIPAFNLGFGMYPKPAPKSLKRILGYAFALNNKFYLMKPFFSHSHTKLIEALSEKIDYGKKVNTISARFRYESYPESIGYQRFLFEKIIENKNSIKTGIIPPKEYFNELQTSLVTLSPFGYGEVCVRDFEAIIYGSLLLKPDMSQIKTYPDIYIPNETYIPVQWDGTDLLDIADNILSNPNPYYQIIENARVTYRNSLINIEEKFDRVFGPLCQK